MSEKLRVGTSSWSHDSWKGSVYPPGAKSGEYLAHYARRFKTVEIDSSWYRCPSEAAVRKWERDTPSDFRFSAKVPSSITHEKRLVGCEAELAEFLKVMDLLGPKRGPLVFQFPYDFKPDQFDTLARFLRTLPAGIPFALEVRHRGWLTERFYDLLRSRGIALVLLDLSWMPRLNLLTTDWTYLRFIGNRKLIETQTTTWEKIIVDRSAEMADWAPRVQKFLDDGVVTWAYFNNHYAGHAPGSVDLFLQFLESRRRGPVRPAANDPLAWSRLQEIFESDGALLDLYVPSAGPDGWRRFLRFLKDRALPLEFEIDGQAAVLPADYDTIRAIGKEASLTLRIAVGKLGLNCHFFDEDEVEVDVDPKQVSEATVVGLLEFMRGAGLALSKDVFLSAEGDRDRPYLVYEQVRNVVRNLSVGG